MNGRMAQLVALTCFGNACLSRRQTPRFFPDNSTCQFCSRVDFAEQQKTLLRATRESEVAGDPDAWFNYLKAGGAMGIRLWHGPREVGPVADRNASAFANGGSRWTMEVLYPGNVSRMWEARWENAEGAAMGGRQWHVRYLQTGQGKSRKASQVELADTVRALELCLKQALRFAAKENLESFRECFEVALETIQSRGHSWHGYHQDLAPAGFLSLDAMIVLDACQKAWVFGGTGSWNDLSFEGDSQLAYEDLSERLFQAVIDGIQCAATSSAAPHLQSATA